jgi:signal transduction histidine kinase
MVNYTAYATSALTGWSSHVAISAALLDAPMHRAHTFLVLGALAVASGALLLLMVAIRDFAKRSEEAQRLLELQRAEAVAQFTATVVHDFRNIVSTVVSGLRLIKRKTQNAEIKDHVDMIESSIQRGSKLANQLLSFSAGDVADQHPVQLQQVVAGLEFMIAQAVGPSVTVSIEIPASQEVLANRDQLELAILNLAINARDAMSGVGHLSIKTREKSDRIEIIVSDTGPGVPAERRRMIFEPFETDKPKGTGLGLAQVAGMAQQAGGAVYVTDAEGGGAEFVIRLPKVTGSKA